MTWLKSNVLIWISGSVVIAYLYSYYQYGYYLSKFGADLTALVGLAFMAASTTYPAMKALRNLGRTDTDKFIISYWSVWLIFLAHRLWVIYLGALNTPESKAIYEIVRESPVSGLIAIMIAISAAHGATAPFSGSIELKKRDLIIFTAAGTFSGIVAGAAIAVFAIAGWN